MIAYVIGMLTTIRFWWHKVIINSNCRNYSRRLCISSWKSLPKRPCKHSLRGWIFINRKQPIIFYRRNINIVRIFLIIIIFINLIFIDIWKTLWIIFNIDVYVLINRLIVSFWLYYMIILWVKDKVLESIRISFKGVMWTIPIHIAGLVVDRSLLLLLVQKLLSRYLNWSVM